MQTTMKKFALIGQGARLLIKDAIANYLKFLESVESSSPHTLRAYKNDLLQVFEDSLESAIKPTLLLELSREAQKRWGSLSAASRNRKVATLKSFFRHMNNLHVFQEDLGLHLASPRVPKKIPNFLSVDEAVSVLKTLRQDVQVDPKFRPDLLLFLLLYGAGLRVSEACSLKWKQIDASFKTGRLIGKGGKERIVAFPNTLSKELKNWQKITGQSASVWGKKVLTTRLAYEIVKKTGIRADLMKGLHPHALRHSFATHLLSSGANLRTLQELLGHSSLQATEKYTHLGVHELAQTLEKHHPMGRGSSDKKPNKSGLN